MRTRAAKGSTKPASSLVALLTVVACTAAGWLSAVAVVNAAELKAKTLDAWKRYVTVTEACMQTELDGEAPFLWVDSLADDERKKAYARLRGGDIYMQCESISLSRGIPFIAKLFVGPIINGLPRDKLTFNLEAMRRHLTQ